MSYIGKQPRKAALTSSDIEDGIITAAKIEDGAVVAAEIASNAVTTAKINADAVTAAKIADDVINSEHIAADSIDAEHYAAGSVDTTALGREIDTVARIGGDEFLVILSQISEVVDTQPIVRNIRDQISQLIHVSQHEVTVGASVGIAVYPDDGTTSDELIRQADKAMYLVKHSKKI